MNFLKLFSQYRFLIIAVLVVSGAVIFLPQFSQISQQKTEQKSMGSAEVLQGDGVVFKFAGEVVSIEESLQSLVVRDDSNGEDITVFLSSTVRFIRLDYSLPPDPQEAEVGIDELEVGSRVVVLAGKTITPEQELRAVQIIYVL